MNVLAAKSCCARELNMKVSSAVMDRHEATALAGGAPVGAIACRYPSAHHTRWPSVSCSSWMTVSISTIFSDMPITLGATTFRFRFTCHPALDIG